MIELLTITPLSVEYYTSTPGSPSVAPSTSSHSAPIFSTVADLSTEESSMVSGNSQVAGPNLGIRVAIPIIIFFVAGLILVISLIIIIYYAKKSKNCKTVYMLTNKRDSSYTHIPLVEAESEGESGDSK